VSHARPTPAGRGHGCRPAWQRPRSAAGDSGVTHPARRTRQGLGATNGQPGRAGGPSGTSATRRPPPTVRPTTRRSTATLVVAAEPMGDRHWRRTGRARLLGVFPDGSGRPEPRLRSPDCGGAGASPDAHPLYRLRRPRPSPAGPTPRWVGRRRSTSPAARAPPHPAPTSAAHPLPRAAPVRRRAAPINAPGRPRSTRSTLPVGPGRPDQRSRSAPVDPINAPGPPRAARAHGPPLPHAAPAGAPPLAHAAPAGAPPLPHASPAGAPAP
jgi:hypothetical protein